MSGNKYRGPRWLGRLPCSGGYAPRRLERSAHLAKQLRSFGLDPRPYEKAPLELEIFAVTIEHRQIRPWAGTAMFQVVGDAKRRQAVLNVSEAGRQLTANTMSHATSSGRPHRLSKWQRSWLTTSPSSCQAGVWPASLSWAKTGGDCLSGTAGLALERPRA